MVVIDLVTRIADLSSILALRSLSTLELPFSSDSGLRVEECPDKPGVRLLFVPGCDCPVVEATTAGDNVQWEVRHPDALDEDLRLALAAIGTARGVNQVDLEIFDDRVTGIDMIWCLARRVRLEGIEQAVTLVATLVNLAGAWERNRALLFDAERPNRNLLKERDRLVAQTQAVCAQWSPRLESITLQEEPRGAALSVKFSGAIEGFGLSGMVADWSADPTFGFAAAAGEPALSIGTGPFRVRPTKLDAAVAGALATTLIDGHEVRLVKQLKPALFTKVAALFGDLGATWAWNRQAYVFPRPAGDVLALALRHGVIFTRRDFEFFETQQAEVQRMIREAHLQPGMKVMEPSAGHGALALAAAEIVGQANVTCHELMPENVDVLRSLGFDVSGPQDFLALTPAPRFNVVLLNPPFSGGRDIAHVRHALGFLKPGGRLVAITSSGWRRRTEDKAGGSPNKVQRDFAALVQQLGGVVSYIEAGAFAAVGTDVETCLVCLTAPDAEAGVGAPRAERTTQRTAAHAVPTSEEPREQLALELF